MPAAILALINGSYQGFGSPSPVPTPDPDPAPTPDPVPSTNSFAMGLTAGQIQALPRSGAEWTNMLARADEPYDINFNENDADNDLPGGGGATDGSSSAFCGGLVYVATGNVAYKNKVNAALDRIEAWGVDGLWHHAAFNRKMGGWALAGQLVGRAVRNSNGTLTSWGRFLSDIRFKIGTGPARANPMHSCAWDWSNNHGAAARASLACIGAVLGEYGSLTAANGNPIGLADQAKWFRAFCGDKTQYNCWPEDNKTRVYGGLGKTDPVYSNSWMVSSSNWSPINQSTTLFGSAVPLSKDGCLNAEAFRDGTSYSVDGSGRPVMGGSGAQYSFGALSSTVMTACILSAAGYKDVWTWGDSAVKRARAFLSRWNYNRTGGHHESQDPIHKKVYERGGYTFPGLGQFTALPDRSYIMAGTAWLCLSPTWPVAPDGWYS